MRARGASSTCLCLSCPVAWSTALLPGNRLNEPGLLAAAAEKPGGSVAEIDPTYIDDPNGYVPPEAIRGAWLVDSGGKLTGAYQENPRHGVPQDDFSKLTDPDHWSDLGVGLDWAGERLRTRIYEIDGEDGAAER